jgi:hypothetical protein
VKDLDLRKLKYDDLYESPKVSQVLLDFPILAEIIEEMMLSSDDERWSKDALDFLSCTLLGSLESLMNVRNDLRPQLAKQTLMRIALLLKTGCIPKEVNSTHSFCPRSYTWITGF